MTPTMHSAILIAGSLALGACVGEKDLPTQFPEQSHYLIRASEISAVDDQTGEPLDLRIIEVRGGQLTVQ